jgi:hypothetical protein
MMKERNLNRVFLYLLFFCITALLCIADRNPIHYIQQYGKQAGFYFMYEGVLDQSIGIPYVFRILIPYTIDGIHSILPAVAPHHIALALEAILLFACQLFLFRYLSLFVKAVYALLGVILMDVLLGYALNHIPGISVIEVGDLFNLLVFILTLMALQRNQLWLALVVLLVGMLNRETPLILLPAIIYHLWETKAQKQWVTGMVVVTVIPYLALRQFTTSENGLPFLFDKLQFNVPFINMDHFNLVVKSNLQFGFLVFPLLLLGLWKYKSLPPILKYAALTSIPFIILHYFVGTIIESRLWIPLFALLIPAVVYNLQSILANLENTAKS